MPKRIAGIRPMAGLVLLVAAASTAGAQSESLSSVASELADTIGGSSLRGAIHDPAVLVKDFEQTDGARTALGPKLADQFSKALIDTQKPGALGMHLPAFHVIEVRESPSIPESDVSIYGRECNDPKIGAAFVVDGGVDVLPHTIVLRIVTTRARDKQKIFDERITLPLDAEMRSLLAMPVPDPRAPSKNELVDWVRPGFRVEGGANAPQVDALKGYTAVQCIYCPRADYSDAAMAGKVQGVVTMDVLFDSQGLPVEIAIVDGLPCGLNRRAIDAIARWRVTPAKDPGGKPTAVWTTVKMTFQLY